MAEIDDKIREVMSEMARRRWAKSTPEERRAFGMFLVTTKKKKVVPPASGSRPEPVATGTTSTSAQITSNGLVPAGNQSGRGESCFRCRSGYHDRCLGPSCGCGCVEKPEWS